MDIKIIRTNNCGFCSGVNRAVYMAENASKKGKVYTFGPIIHNPQFVENQKRNGIIPINDIADITEPGSILIRSHGITVEDETTLRDSGQDLIDATCPKVKRAHRICESFAESYDTVFIIGAKSHPEVKGILSRARGKGVVISSLDEVYDIPKTKNAGVLVQTTFRKEQFFNIASEILKKVKIIHIHNTICEETVERQKELLELADKVELLIIIGGKNSSNTKRLSEMGAELKETHHVEISGEINYKWLIGKTSLGIVTGASTPLNLVDEVEQEIKKLTKKINEKGK